MNPAYATSTILELLAVAAFGYFIGRLHAAWRDPHAREERRRRASQAKLTAAANAGRLDSETRRKAEQMLDGGHKLDVVRLVRTKLNLGLKEAKDVTDHLDEAARRTGRK